MEQLMDELDVQDKKTEQKRHPMEDLISVSIGEDLNKVVQVSSNLCEENCQHLIFSLWANANVFAWTVSGMPHINSEVVMHRLNVDPKYHPIRQKKYSFALDHHLAS